MQLMTKPFGVQSGASEHNHPPDAGSTKSLACGYCLGTGVVKTIEAGGTREAACTCQVGRSPLIEK